MDKQNLEKVSDSTEPKEALTVQIPLWLKAEALQAASDLGIPFAKYLNLCVYEGLYNTNWAIAEKAIINAEIRELSEPYSPSKTVAFKCPLWLKSAVMEAAEHKQITLSRVVLLCVYQERYPATKEQDTTEPPEQEKASPTTSVEQDSSRGGYEEVQELKEKFPDGQIDLGAAERFAKLVEEKIELRDKTLYLEKQLENEKEKVKQYEIKLKELEHKLDQYKRSISKAIENLRSILCGNDTTL